MAEQTGETAECDDSPKLTAEEWAYVQAVTDAEPSKGGDG